MPLTRYARACAPVSVSLRPIDAPAGFKPPPTCVGCPTQLHCTRPHIEETTVPPTNPKELRAVADGKAPLDCLESAGNAETAYVMRHGADKYGYRNYTISPCKVRTYTGAVGRHLDAIKLGEDVDPDSGRSHWAHIRACADVVMGAESAGTLIDDRAASTITPEPSALQDGRTGRTGPTAGVCRLPYATACVCYTLAAEAHGCKHVFSADDRMCD